MPKKAPRNGFFFFMLDERKRLEKLGQRFQMSEMPLVCCDSWKALTLHEKAEYNSRAKDYRSKGNVVEKYSSMGIPLSSIENHRKSQKDLEHFIDQKIIEIIDKTTDLKNQPFYFIYFNYFCKNSNGTYIPAEVSLLKYSLKEGIIDSYNKTFKPLELPLGMMFTATSYSLETHKLPVPPRAIGESNFKKILDEIIDFIKDKDHNTMFPLITNVDNIQMVTSILSELCNTDYDEKNFLIIPLTKVFFKLKTATSKLGGTEGFKSIHMAETFLEMDLYDNQFGKACDLHEELESNRFCALSFVKRWAFTISDHCCADLNITMIPGLHVPFNANTTIKHTPSRFADTDDDTASCMTDSFVSYDTSRESAITEPIKVINDDQSLCSGMSSVRLNTTRNAWRQVTVREPMTDTLNFPAICHGLGGRGRGSLFFRDQKK